MSVLERDALLEHKNAKLAAPRSGSLMSSQTRPKSAIGGGRCVHDPPRGGRAKTAHVRSPKRLDQEMGFLNVGTYFTVSIYPSSVVMALMLGMMVLVSFARERSVTGKGGQGSPGGGGAG